MQDLAADYVFIGDKSVDFEIPGMLGVVANAENWEKNYSNKKHFYPLYNAIPEGGFKHKTLNFLEWNPKNTAEIDQDRKSTRLNSSHVRISYAVFCLKKK